MLGGFKDIVENRNRKYPITNNGLVPSTKEDNASHKEDIPLDMRLDQINMKVR